MKDALGLAVLVVGCAAMITGGNSPPRPQVRLVAIPGLGVTDLGHPANSYLVERVDTGTLVRFAGGRGTVLDHEMVAMGYGGREARYGAASAHPLWEWLEEHGVKSASVGWRGLDGAAPAPRPLDEVVAEDTRRLEIAQARLAEGVRFLAVELLGPAGVTLDPAAGPLAAMRAGADYFRAMDPVLHSRLTPGSGEFLALVSPAGSTSPMGLTGPLGPDLTDGVGLLHLPGRGPDRLPGRHDPTRIYATVLEWFDRPFPMIVSDPGLDAIRRTPRRRYRWERGS